MEDNAAQPDLIERLVRFNGDLRFEDIPHAVTNRLKVHVADVVASALAATSAEGIPELVGLVKHWGGRPEASVVGHDVQVPIPLAALTNAMIARALELDDVHEKALLHPTVAVVPLALAVAEGRGGVSGREFLAAITAAEEITCRLGLAPEYHVAGDQHRPRGWSYTYQCGTFGGTLAAARLLGLDHAKSVDAMGNAYTALAGNQQAVQERVLAIRAQQGVCAQTAAQAALMAEAGITGPRHVLEGLFGWLTFWQDNRYDRDVITDGLGDRWHVEGISIKPYPCCRITHNAINATISTLAREGLRAEDIERLVMHVNSRESWDEVVQPVEQRRVPRSATEAQFSMPFVVAVAAVRGSVTLGDLHGAGLHDSDVLAFAQRVEPVFDEDADVSRGRILPMPVTIDLHSRDGRVFSGTSDFPPGHPNNPMTWDAVVDKLQGCAAWDAVNVDKQRLDELVARIRNIEQVDDMRDVAHLLATVKTGSVTSLGPRTRS
jgi:2-methylcitrate dehydratase PrpD